jgi:elongation factor G
MMNKLSNKLSNLRNIGISAHIDSGKTTLSERFLYYAGRIHRMNEVKGDGAGATMDYMDLERERGITITSAATTVEWEDKQINLIDTPGHVDFTVEVERSLRVLDGAILVLCAVGGVQSQSITVDRQMKRYQVPRLAFINKMDRTGANPAKVIEQLETKLDIEAVPMQIPIGAEANFDGVIDLVTMRAVHFDGENGESVRYEQIPNSLRSAAEHARTGMLETLSLYSDELMELLLDEQSVPQEMIHDVVRRATIAQEITPVFVGSAYKNKGVQLLLDAVCRYLPSPLDRTVVTKNLQNDGADMVLAADPDAPTVAMAFKIVDEPFGQLTYMRVYQGTINKGEFYKNARLGKTQRFSRIVRMHADEREDMDLAGPGEIVAVMGIDCASGDTYCSEDVNLSLESIYVPDPVISLAIAAAKRQDTDKLAKALQRFRKEDPTFHVSTDRETKETIISGMGELHLEIYVERIRREYKVEVEVGRPKVSYREAPTIEVEFNYKHKKQTGGAGQYAHIKGKLSPLSREESLEPYVFEDNIVGGRIPVQYIPSVDKGFQIARQKGPLGGYEIVGVKMTLDDGSYHEVDSSDLAFQICAQDCFRESFLRAKPVLLEPIMKVEVEVPTEFRGSVTGDLSSRRGMITSAELRGSDTVVTAEMPLATMFGYSTDLRSMTQGKGTFSMEFLEYRRVPQAIQEEIIAAKKAEMAK